VQILKGASSRYGKHHRVRHPRGAAGWQIHLSLSGEARAWLAQQGFDATLGARPMARLIERQIAAPLADSILFGPLHSGGAVRVEVQGGSLHVAVSSPAVLPAGAAPAQKAARR